MTKKIDPEQIHLNSYCLKIVFCILDEYIEAHKELSKLEIMALISSVEISIQYALKREREQHPNI